jgi:alpha-L-fucosidase
MKLKFDIPSLAPEVILQVSKAAEEADVQFGLDRSRAKKVWIREKVMPAVSGVKLGKVPPWLVEPIKEAAVSVIIDTLWAIREEQREEAG